VALAQDALLARNLAATCANCHGTNGNALGDMKPLAGISADKIIAAVADYKSGAQPATVMHQIAKGYTDEQIKLIAGYLAAQQPKK
jgi:cytochrome c553